MEDTGEAKSVGTVLRVVRLLRFLAETGGEVTVTQISDQLQLPASTVHRLLHLLIAEGIVQHDPASRRYQVGVELIRISSLIATGSSLKAIARPFVQAVVDRCNEACLFVVHLPSTHQVSVLEGINSSHPLRYELQIYAAHSLLWGATGRSVLAFLPEAEQEMAMALGTPSPADGRPAPPRDQLRADLRSIRARGYAVSWGEKIPGAVGLGAPVLMKGDKVVGSLCLTIPQMRFEAAQEPALTHLLKQQAELLSRALGYKGSYPPAAG
ncbi:IclR family transcriptional regulator [Muricoccus aerilatus]|uniref:IclR family transcriptional regulator n=1 Tax=Muricoccus aerilatus TaxID=452982 RepID=UPI0005C2156B|nr:IclR family transcriptional regulator [Roseomonas aerilata]